jgi:ABC-2 type transport system ATP-binding protein
MAARWIELVTGSLDQKKQYRQYRARMEALPEPYLTAAKALHRYFMYNVGTPTDESALTMFSDFVDLWERAAADGTPVRQIVGEDPVEFADAFVQAYVGKRWIDKERARLTKAIDSVAASPRSERGTDMTSTPETPQAAIVVQGLRKSYKTLDVLHGVDFAVPPGSIFALLGSNGAGKTTLVRILSTLLSADAGTAQVNGFDTAVQPGEVRRSISLTGQFAAVDEILTGRENLVLVARLRHLDDPGAVADDLLARFGLKDAASRRVSTYSGGMRRRLDIAMSLIGDPPVIFLDEPTTGLDPQGRLEVWQAVKELAAGGTTVLLTTQYLDEAEQLADRIAILHDGRILVDGTLGELKALLPPAEATYVEKQPTLEDVFLTLVGEQRTTDATSSTDA